MKYLLLISLALLSVNAFSAAGTGTGGPAAPPAPDTTTGGPAAPPPTSTDTGTSTSTDTTAPPPVSYAEKFGNDWASSKQNKDLLKDPALVDDATKEGNLSQEDSYILVSNTLYGCVEVAASGREDDVCNTDRNHPECVGVARALANATNCLEYFTPATLGCKTYGTTEYNLEEWIAVGDQFQAQMVDCAEKKKQFDDTKVGLKLESLTENIGAANYKTSAPGAPDIAGMLLAPQSNVSGDIKPDINVTALDWSELSTKVKDGASYLGYHDGDIVRASLKGETFAAIVTESPFAKSLNIENRAKLDEGLADSKLIASRVIQTYQDNGGQSLAGNEQPSNSPAADQPEGIRINLGQTNLGSVGNGDTSVNEANNSESQGTGPTTATGGAVAPGGNGGSGGGKAAANTAEARKMLEAERLEEVARAAAIYRAENKPYRSPASVVQSKVEDLLDTTLFHRISQAYRRKSAGMKTFDTRSGDLIRSIERPEIFRSL